MILKTASFVFSRKTINKVPQEPGVYIFYNLVKKVIYVGKAINLRSRLYSYTLAGRDAKTARMLASVYKFSYIRVTSEIEALILEASLVQKFLPKYNIQLKDDKSPLYIVITKDKYPRVLTARGRNLQKGKVHLFGPFLSGRSVYFVLKTIRKIFPYATHLPEKKACLYSQIGLCSPCPSTIERASESEKSILVSQYIDNVVAIKKLLNGNFASLTTFLKRKMRKSAQMQNFELAARIKNTLDELVYLATKPTPSIAFIENPNLKTGMREQEMGALKKALGVHFLGVTNPTRIECYDSAHVSGDKPATAMVTFINAEPEKGYYRHFKIKGLKGASDTDSLREACVRRTKHFEDWGKPDLVVVDGGRAQISTAQNIFSKFGLPVVGIAKLSASLIIPTKKAGSTYTFRAIALRGRGFEHLLIRLKDEAHRFSRKLHHKMMRDSYGLM